MYNGTKIYVANSAISSCWTLALPRVSVGFGALYLLFKCKGWNESLLVKDGPRRQETLINFHQEFIWSTSLGNSMRGCNNHPLTFLSFAEVFIPTCTLYSHFLLGTHLRQLHAPRSASCILSVLRTSTSWQPYGIFWGWTPKILSGGISFCSCSWVVWWNPWDWPSTWTPLRSVQWCGWPAAPKPKVVQLWQNHTTVAFQDLMHWNTVMFLICRDLLPFTNFMALVTGTTSAFCPPPMSTNEVRSEKTFVMEVEELLMIDCSDRSQLDRFSSGLASEAGGWNLQGTV